MKPGELKALRYIAAAASLYLHGMDGSYRAAPAKDQSARWDALKSALRAAGYYPPPDHDNLP